jgi:hypothetical protein
LHQPLHPVTPQEPCPLRPMIALKILMRVNNLIPSALLAIVSPPHCR